MARLTRLDFRLELLGGVGEHCILEKIEGPCVSEDSSRARLAETLFTLSPQDRCLIRLSPPSTLQAHCDYDLLGIAHISCPTVNLSDEALETSTPPSITALMKGLSLMRGM
jgi:hypothetical protein